MARMGGPLWFMSRVYYQKRNFFMAQPVFPISSPFLLPMEPFTDIKDLIESVERAFIRSFTWSFLVPMSQKYYSISILNQK